MSNRAFVLALGLLFAGPKTHSQSQDPAEVLRAARSLRCAFPSGGSEVLTDAKPRYEPAQGADGVFDDIDRGKGIARHRTCRSRQREGHREPRDTNVHRDVGAGISTDD